MTTSKLRALLSVALALAFVAACAPSIIKETVVVEIPFERIVKETVVVAVPLPLVVEKLVVVDKPVVVEVPVERIVERTVVETVIFERTIEKIITATPLPPTDVPPPPKIRMYFAPLTERDQALASGQVIADILAQMTGYEFEVAVPASYAVAIEAMCSDKADVAWLAALAYVLANNKCGVIPMVQGERFGYYNYRAEIIVQSDTVRKAWGLEPITSIEDLNGKTFAFSDTASEYGYLFAKVMLERAGVELSEEIFTGGHTQSVVAVYTGDVDAGAAYWSPLQADGTIGDARRRLIEDFPDVVERVKILALSDPIPNLTVGVRSTLDPEVAQAIQWALLDLVKTVEGAQATADLYGVTGFILGDDARYDPVREAGDTLGYDILERALQ